MRTEADEKRKRKIGIAGICVWAILLGIVIFRSYNQGRSSPTISHKVF